MNELFFMVGKAVCHQLPQRSFMIGGSVLPLCARCTGIYIGIFTAFFYFCIRRRLTGNEVLTGGQAVLSGIAFLPFMLDGFGSYIGLWNSNNFLRIVTGVPAGISLPYFFILLIHFDVNGKNDKPIYKGLVEMMLLFFIGFIGAIWVDLGFFGWYAVISSILCLGVVCFYGLLAALFLHLVFHLKEKRLVVSSVMFSIVVIILIAWVRR